MNSDYIKIKEIKPALTDHIKEAQILLKQSAVPDEKAVHDVRVLMKKCRAIMRLISGQIEKESFDRDFLSYREVGRLMCSWRETSVHRKTLKDLRRKYSGIFEELNQDPRVEALMKKQEQSSEPDQKMKENLELIDEHLSKAGYRLRFQTWNELDPKKLIFQLDASYKNVVSAYLQCRHNPKQANIHKFRKRVKDLLYQLWFFRPLNQKAVKNLENKLEDLALDLGKCNDLSVLLNALGYSPSYSSEDPAFDKLALIIRQEQDKYLGEIWPVAFKIFSPGQNFINILGFKILIL